VYTCNISSGVRVYENTTTATASDSWSLVGGSIVDTSSSGEQYTSDIAIDANNNLYVSYVSNSANGTKLNVKKFNGTAWVQLGNSYFSPGKVQHVAIAVSSSGAPYVVASRWENDNLLKNTVYKLDTTTNMWGTFGGDFISDDQATYNDIAVDNVNNYLVIAYSQSGTKVKRISLGVLSTNEVKTNESFSVYPNPTNGIVFIKNEGKIKSAEITNSVGQVVNARVSDKQIDLNGVPNGVYFIKIQLENGKTVTKKVIKK
jgi:hypothetical protein